MFQVVVRTTFRLVLPRWESWWSAALLGVSSARGTVYGLVEGAEPLAVLDGRTLSTRAELPQAVTAQMKKMMEQVYGVEMRGLHGVLDKRLIADEAKKKGVSAEELYQAEVVSKVPDPSEETMKAYYVARQEQFKGQPYESVRGQILQGMKSQEIQKAEVLYVQGLLQKAVDDGELVLLLTPPKLDLPIDPKRMKGEMKAPVI